MEKEKRQRLRSEIWFNDMTGTGRNRRLPRALHQLRHHSRGTAVGQADHRHRTNGRRSDSVQSDSHEAGAERVKDGIRDAGGFAFEFPMHPMQESCRRPTAALDRNLAYLGLVEIFCGYPFDGVVLMTGCDKTTPACLMAAATVNLPPIVLSGGPMIDSLLNGKLAGSGMALWEARRHAGGREIDDVRIDRYRLRLSRRAPGTATRWARRSR